MAAMLDILLRRLTSPHLNIAVQDGAEVGAEEVEREGLWPPNSRRMPLPARPVALWPGAAYRRVHDLNGRDSELDDGNGGREQDAECRRRCARVVMPERALDLPGQNRVTRPRV